MASLITVSLMIGLFAICEWIRNLPRFHETGTQELMGVSALGNLLILGCGVATAVWGLERTSTYIWVSVCLLIASLAIVVKRLSDRTKPQ